VSFWPGARFTIWTHTEFDSQRWELFQMLHYFLTFPPFSMLAPFCFLNFFFNFIKS
jgi:hypothetical protein